MSENTTEGKILSAERVSAGDLAIMDRSERMNALNWRHFVTRLIVCALLVGWYMGLHSYFSYPFRPFVVILLLLTMGFWLTNYDFHSEGAETQDRDSLMPGTYMLMRTSSKTRIIYGWYASILLFALLFAWASTWRTRSLQAHTFTCMFQARVEYPKEEKVLFYETVRTSLSERERVGRNFSIDPDNMETCMIKNQVPNYQVTDEDAKEAMAHPSFPGAFDKTKLY